MVISYEFLRFLEEEEKKRKVGLLLNLALNDENLRSYEFILIRQNVGYNSCHLVFCNTVSSQIVI